MFSKFAILPYTYCYSFTKDSLPYLLKLMLVIYFVLALKLGDWMGEYTFKRKLAFCGGRGDPLLKRILPRVLPSPLA
jgi:hypothetical protein